MARPLSQKTVVSRLFANCSRPIYLLDTSRRIVFCNESLAKWLQVSVEELVGRRCVYCNTERQDKSNLSNQLCPPPQAWQSSTYHGLITVRAAGGKQQRSASFFPLSLDQQPSPMLVMLDEQDNDDSPAELQDAETLHRQIIELREAWSVRFTLDRLVGQSPAMRQVRSRVEIATQSACRVLIVGQSGTGRETVARTIHRHRSQGRRAPLVPLSCSVLDAALLESTVEACVRQAAELSDEAPGTLLLLDVDQLSPEAQAALLGFMAIPELELQTMATSQQRLSQLVAEQKFRNELASDLVTLEIFVPHLSDRMEDVPLLAQWLVEEENRTGEKQLGGFTPAAMDELLGYDWPGELNELRQLVRIAHQTAAGPLIQPTELPEKLRLAADASAMAPVVEEKIVLDEFLAEVEAELIVRALKQAKGNKAQAARLLHISRARLLRRIEHLGVER